MKKLIGCMILLFCFLSEGTVAYAAVGDVIGNIYATRYCYLSQWYENTIV